MPPDSVLLRDLRKQFADGQVVVVAGAGVAIGASGNARVASWMGLLEDGVERCMQLAKPAPSAAWRESALAELKSRECELMLSAAEKIATKLKGPEFASWLRDTIGELKIVDSSVIGALASLRVPILTTNYDGLLSAGLAVPAVSDRDRDLSDRVVRGVSPGVIHLHGFWEHPETVVLGTRSYERQLANEHAQSQLRALAMTRTLVFIGFGSGLDDPTFQGLAKWADRALADSTFRRYRLERARDIEHVVGADARMFAVPYGDDFADLPSFLRSLSPSAFPRREAASPAIPSASPPASSAPAPRQLHPTPVATIARSPQPLPIAAQAPPTQPSGFQRRGRNAALAVGLVFLLSAATWAAFGSRQSSSNGRSIASTVPLDLVRPAATRDPALRCLGTSQTGFHLRPTETRESVGVAYPTGTAFEILAPGTITRLDPPLGVFLSYRVRVLSDDRVGFVFVPSWWFDRSCPDSMPRSGPTRGAR